MKTEFTWPLVHFRPLHRMRLVEGVNESLRAPFVSAEQWQGSDGFNLHSLPIARQLSSAPRKKAKITAGEKPIFRAFLNKPLIIFCN